MPQDYHASVNAVLEAREMFESLPSSVRRRFGNDPAAFLDFVGDEENRDEMEKMGLLKAGKVSPEGEPDKKDTTPADSPHGISDTKSTPQKEDTKIEKSDKKNGAWTVHYLM